MNMQAIMMQAKKMQKDMENKQKELEGKFYEGKSQLVTATISGKNELVSIKIDTDEISSDDKEMLEDMVMIAVNDAIKKMEADKQEKFGQYGNMLNGLM
jgi:DNA-binding YbaB/EbfC family protein